MNERIRKLAQQAGAGWDHKYHWYVGSETMQKFAELIVRDCLRIAEEQRIKILKNPSDPSWTEHLAEVQTNIRQHFGVY